jgi:triosephosphate isomerase (TIM)
MKRFIIGSGWKMNNNMGESLNLLRDLIKTLDGFDDFPLFVLPPFTSLNAVKMLLGQEKQIQFGAQNMHWEETGAFTGEIAAPMLVELGCTYVEINHQERRTYFNETNQTANRKVISALKHGLKPILCLGEEEIMDDVGVRDFLRQQVEELLDSIRPEDIGTIVLAYELRWAIGMTEAAPASHVQKVHGIIREVLGEVYGPVVAKETYIIYGGSVDRSNAVEIAIQPEVDGLFIGRAGLNAETFCAIIQDVTQTLRIFTEENHENSNCL